MSALKRAGKDHGVFSYIYKIFFEMKFYLFKKKMQMTTGDL